MQDSPAQVIIRDATPADIDQLCALLGLLFAQEEDFSPDPDRQARALRMIFDQPHAGRIFCAADRDRVVGMVCILFSVSTAEGGPDARLEDFIIHPGYRRQGIGERLLDEVFRRAREAGCARLTLLTDHTNESAIRFYRRAGFLPSRMIPFRISL